ncbi:MAG: DUF1304 domain-containing protein [Streptococcaceae bacterium]|jgi:putative membrane protein|nr:DUF1304 domain-containing protein [Streptococcaceae bacterium]
MTLILFLLLLFVGFEHLIFGLVELVGKPELQAKAFDFSVDDLKNPAVNLALRNQGIYNLAFGFLVLYALLGNTPWQVFAGLMAFVVLVGIYGGATVTKKIYAIQALPALLTFLLLLFIH